MDWRGLLEGLWGEKGPSDHLLIGVGTFVGGVIGILLLVFVVRVALRMARRWKRDERPVAARVREAVSNEGTHFRHLLLNDVALCAVLDSTYSIRQLVPVSNRMAARMDRDQLSRFAPRSTAGIRIAGILGGPVAAVVLAYIGLAPYGALDGSHGIPVLIGLACAGMVSGFYGGFMFSRKPLWIFRRVDGTTELQPFRYPDELRRGSMTPKYVADKRRQNILGRIMRPSSSSSPNPLVYGSIGLAIVGGLFLMYLFYTTEQGSDSSPAPEPTPVVRDVETLFREESN